MMYSLSLSSYCIVHRFCDWFTAHVQPDPVLDSCKHDVGVMSEDDRRKNTVDLIGFIKSFGIFLLALKVFGKTSSKIFEVITLIMVYYKK